MGIESQYREPLVNDRPDKPADDFRRYLPGSGYEPGAPAPHYVDPLEGYEQPGDTPVTTEPAQPTAPVDRREAKRLRKTEAAPARHPKLKRSKKAKGVFVSLLNLGVTATVLALVVGVGLFLWGRAAFEAPGPLQAETSIIVKPGDNFSSIVPELVAKNVIESGVNDEIFPIAVRLAGKAGDLKTGEFAFQPGVSMRGVMDELTSGKAVVHKITFPEGWTVWQMWERLVEKRNEGLLTGELPEMPAEGELLPATYTFTRGRPAAEIVAEMKRERDRAVERIWQDRDPDLPISSKEEMVTLASIVEKETGMDGERGRVAAVFHNRLRRNMRLDSDPTIIYARWGGQGKPDGYGGLRRSDLRVRSPYNTRRVKGLTPGPIANPGREAMRAVANPPKTDDLYFVADGTGGHVFATTLREHNRNVANWRKVERERAGQ